MAVSKEQWKNEPLPSEKEALDYDRFFDDAEAELLREGHLPVDMDDKWFIYFEEGWLNFHRSWTGHCIYSIKLDGSPAGVRVTESWVNRNPEQYQMNDTQQDRALLNSLIENFLLNLSEA